MNQITRGWGQSRVNSGSRRSRLTRHPRSRWRIRSQSRLPGMMLASLGLGILGTMLMWSAVSTAHGASGPSGPSGPNGPSGVLDSRVATFGSSFPSRRSSTLASTEISAVPVLRVSTDSGTRTATRPITRSTKRMALRPNNRLSGRKLSETIAVTILPIQSRQAKQAKQANRPTKSAVGQDRGQASESSKVRGRLPRYFGKVGVSVNQKRRVYSIQAIYRERLATLTRQVEALKAQERQEVLEVLTVLQKQRLSELIRMADAARAARLRAKQSARPGGSSGPVGPGESVEPSRSGEAGQPRSARPKSARPKSARRSSALTGGGRQR
jgi:hypothetical protein